MDSIETECNTGCYSPSDCKNIGINYFQNKLQDKLDSTMPWIGMYIAAASVVCSLAMAADAFHGFRSKKLWFPCKYFSFNAMSLTLLAVALKLPADITASKLGVHDMLARDSSLVFMSTAMENFMTSLGSMDVNEMLLNLAALSIMVITVITNVCVFIIQRSSLNCLPFRDVDVLCIIVKFRDVTVVFVAEAATFIMLISLVILCSSALTVLTTRSYIECKLRLVLKKYWVMAETGCPQFVMARSVTCAASSLMCVLLALNLVYAHIRMPIIYPRAGKTSSTYKWSVNWILYVQSIGVALGTIAPAFKCSDIGRKSFKNELKIEPYWIQRLVDWRESSLPLQVQHPKIKKLLHAVRRQVLNCCLGVQILLVWASKLVILISASFFHIIKMLKIFVISASYDNGGSESGSDAQLDLTRYVLLLQGEPGIPKNIFKNILNEEDKMIEKGKRQKPISLMELVHKSNNFNGVKEFDNNGVPSLHSRDPPNSWSLPVVTLTCIAISLPNISDDRANQLLRCIRQGISLLKIIEKSLDENGALAIIRNAADVVWVGVDLYCKWQDKDLRKTSHQGRTSNETLEKLSNEAERTVLKFLTEENDFLMDNPLNWPDKIIAANSMYGISRTILLADGNKKTDEGLFDHLSVMIADILAASLTNLPHVIMMKCHHGSPKERQKIVRQAALLLGETEEILQILEQREIPILDPDKAAYIDEWRHTFIEEDDGNSLASISSIGSEIQQSNEEHVAIELHG